VVSKAKTSQGRLEEERAIAVTERSIKFRFVFTFATLSKEISKRNIAMTRYVTIFASPGKPPREEFATRDFAIDFRPQPPHL
jgi:hypothetical protein